MKVALFGATGGTGTISRADVAGVLAALLHEPRTAGLALELIGGVVPTEAAVAAVTERAD